MDILESNCPHLLPKEAEAPSSPPLSPTRLKFDEPYFTGVSAGETSSTELVEPCDDGYLQSCWKRMQHITEIIAIWGAACAICPEFWDTTTRGAAELGDDPETLDWARHLGKQALEDLSNIAEELQRLQHHPELFETSEKAKYFWKKSLKILKQARKLVRCFRLLNQAQDELEALRTKHTGSAPRKEIVTSPDPDISYEAKPWQSWCRMIPLARNSLAARDFRESNKEMELSTSQLLPTQGVLIAEHWRRKVEAMVQDISQQSPDPDLVLTQLPSHDSSVLTTRQDATKATVRHPAPIAPWNKQTANILAFGKQSREAGAARLMANMEQDVTTRGDRRGMFMGTFHTPQEKEEVVDPSVSEE